MLRSHSTAELAPYVRTMHSITKMRRAFPWGDFRTLTPPPLSSAILFSSILSIQFEKCQERLLQFLGEFITLLGTRVIDSLVAVKSLCMTMFNENNKSRTKVALFAPLKAVMTVPLACERARRDQLASELEISLVAKRYVCYRFSAPHTAW